MRILLAFLVALPVIAQQTFTAPSQDELGGLINKADQKIVNAEDATKLMKAELDKIDGGIATKTLDAAKNGHTLIRNMKKNGATAYGLVALIATLDDTSNNLATQVIDLTVTHGIAGDLATTADRLSLPAVNARNGCNDISELLLHATLRLISNEEEALHKVMEMLDKKP